MVLFFKFCAKELSIKRSFWRNFFFAWWYFFQRSCNLDWMCGCNCVYVWVGLGAWWRFMSAQMYATIN